MGRRKEEKLYRMGREGVYSWPELAFCYPEVSVTEILYGVEQIFFTYFTCNNNKKFLRFL